MWCLVTKQEDRNEASVADLGPAFSKLSLLLLASHIGSKFHLLVLNLCRWTLPGSPVLRTITAGIFKFGVEMYRAVPEQSHVMKCYLFTFVIYLRLSRFICFLRFFCLAITSGTLVFFYFLLFSFFHFSILIFSIPVPAAVSPSLKTEKLLCADKGCSC